MNLMSRLLSAFSAGASYLVVVSSVYAAEIKDPSGISSNTNIKAENVPQFAINWIFYLGIVLAAIYLMYGGIKWVTSGGDKTKVESARKHFIAAIVGLVIVVGAFFILNTVFRLTGAENPLSKPLPTLENP